MIGLAGIIANLSMAALVTLSPDLPTSYQMDVRLDTADNNIYASEQIQFLNPTSDTLDQICFHLYPNAFKDTSSVFCRENSTIRSDVASGKTSHLEVKDITIDNQALDSAAINLTGTLLYLKLPARLPPAKMISISLNFELKIPKVLMRFGVNDRGNYLLSHWHPILCGYQKGVLQDFEYHANSEFFSNFSIYDVRLDIPAGFEIGSTGELTQISKDSLRAIYQAHADTVIDFAFASGPAFEVSEADTMGIHLRYLLEKRHQKYRAAVDEITKYSLSYNSKMFFKYPYITFTLVDFAAGAQGMELPGMVVVAFPGTGSVSVGEKILNLTVAHEIAHEWFYGTVATNEANEPWLDEGVTSYVTERLLSSAGDTLGQMSILGFKINYFTFERLAGLMFKAEYPIDLKSWDYPDEMSYGASVYYRSTMVFETLEGLLGRARIDSALGSYAREYRFRHPDGADFKRAIETNAGLDLSLFYSQFVDGTARLDYGIRDLKYSLIEKQDSLQQYDITVKVARELDGILPQTIRITLSDSSTIDTAFEETLSRITLLKFTAKSRPVSAAIISSYPLDENIANNTLNLKSFSSRLVSFEWDMIFLKEFFLSLIL